MSVRLCVVCVRVHSAVVVEKRCIYNLYTVVCPSDPGFVCTSEDGGTQDDDQLPSMPVDEMLIK